MSFARVFSRASLGLDTVEIVIEAHLSFGLPRFNIVGLPDLAVKEAKERVRSALLNSQFEFPAMRITVNLAPCDLPKDGGHFDLPIAIAILVASKQLEIPDLDQYELIGELALSGELCRVQNCLALTQGAQQAERTLALPRKNMHEAQHIQAIRIMPAENLGQMCQQLVASSGVIQCHEELQVLRPEQYPDFSDVQGQQFAKRALEIAAAGGHNVIMIGPPGVGKTMLASRFAGILPPLDHEATLETALIYSYANRFYLWGAIPFREPHHTASYAALVGGSNPPKPGEISLAHHGVLFLDELTEFKRPVLEALREPLEAKKIHISRANHSYTFPANFQLIAAMNPCPCGHLGNTFKTCRCSEISIEKYRQKISGPLLDRIDLQVFLTQDYAYDYQDVVQSESSEKIKARVLTARAQQLKRWKKINSEVSEKVFYQSAYIPESVKNSLNDLIQRYHLSPRVVMKLLRVARTIADLDQNVLLEEQHLLEALHYRMQLL